MAQVTVELRTLIEQLQFNLFDFTYSFDDATFKTDLEQSVTDFFYDYEIGFETPDMFKRKFQARWNRIIPFYNELYNTTVLTYNPLQNLSVTEIVDDHKTSDNTQTSTLSDTRTGSTTADRTVDKTVDNKSSDYPQQPIAGGDYLQGEESGTDNTTDNSTVSSNDTSSSNSSSTNNTTDQTNSTKTKDGIEGTTYQALIQAQRDVIINIKNKVIEEMKPCFILVF